MVQENPWLEWDLGDKFGAELPDEEGYLYTRLRPHAPVQLGSNDGSGEADIDYVIRVRYKPEPMGANYVRFEPLEGQDIMPGLNFYGVLPPVVEEMDGYNLVRLIRDHVEERYGLEEDTAGGF